MSNPPKKLSELLVTPLPCSSSPNPGLNPKLAHEVVSKYLDEVLPKPDKKNFEADIKFHFMLEKQTAKYPHPKGIRKKKTYLTRKERKKLDLLKLPKNNWNYLDLAPLRSLWQQYISQVLRAHKKIPKITDRQWNMFSTTFMKSEFIGSEIKVIRSNVPNLVDHRGTVVLETKSTFQIVTPDNKFKIILKSPCMFEIALPIGKVSFMGNSVLTRPSERSGKKIKSSTVPDL